MAGLENSILVVLGNPEDYKAYRDYVPEEVLSPVSRRLLQYIDTYWKTYDHESEIDWSDFSGWLEHYAATKDSHLGAMKQVCETTADVSTTDTARDILNRAVERDIAEQIEGHLSKDDEVDPILIRDLCDHLESFKARDLTADKLEINTNIEDVLRDSHITGDGLPFSLDILRKSVGPLRPGDTVYVPARPETGKCLGKGTPVLMYDGSVKRVENVDSSDLVMGPYSDPKIPYGFVSGREPLYRVTYPWGESYVVNESHILSLKRSKTEGPHSNGDILNVPLNEYIDWPESRKGRYKGWKTGVYFEEQELEGCISPYILGAWLGDGHSEGPRFTTEDPEILEAFNEEAEKLGLVTTFVSNQNSGNAATYSLSGTQGKKNPFTESLIQLGIKHNKRIPDCYLLNTVECRLAVLAGLLDTDGYANHQGYEIVQSNRNIAEDVVFLARSLGYHAVLKEKSYRSYHHYRVTIYGNFSELNRYMRIERKHIAPNKSTKRQGLHFGIDVQPLGVGEYYGFAVGGDGLFVLGDFTVTHNTTFLVHQTGYMMENSTDTNAIIFSNEEDGNRVMIRLYQSVLGWTTKDVMANPTLARDEYEKKMGSLDRIKIIHSANLHRKDCERVIEKYDPDLIVFNMLSKISGFGTSKYQNDVDMITAQGVWMREIANAHHCAAMTAWQAGGSAHGKAWIEQDDMYGSKTGLPAEADLILGIGKVLDVGVPENQRYLHLSKNKLPGDSYTDEKLRHGYFDDVWLDAERGRYYE